MKILFISPYIPFPMNRGAKLRTASLLHALKNHQVTFLGLHQGGPIDEQRLKEYVSSYEIISHHNKLGRGKWQKLKGW